MKEHSWIKYYNDISRYYEFQRAISILDDFDSNAQYSLNQIIELSNIKRIVESIQCPTNISSEKFADYKAVGRRMGQFVSSYFRNLNEDDIENTFGSVENIYSLDVLKLFERYDLLRLVSKDVFSKLLRGHNIVLYDVLKCSKWLHGFGQEIREYMLNECKMSPEILINCYLRKDYRKREGFVFPKNLTAEDRLQILHHYVDFDKNPNPNPNYLRLIVCAPHSLNDLPIDDRLKMKALRAIRLFQKRNFSIESFYRLKCNAEFKDIDCEKDYLFDEQDKIEHYVYSRKYIEEHHDPISLLNNFISLFEFVDTEFRSNFISKKIYAKNETFMGVDDGIGHYPVGITFDINRIASYYKLDAYIKELAQYNIVIEGLIEFYFETYLKEKFNAEGFSFRKPTEGVTLREKIRILIPDIDGLLKQFSLFQEDGEIDREFLAFSSSSCRFNEIRSFQKIKYVYPKGKNIEREMGLLFSPKLLYGSNFDLDKNPNFETLLKKNDVKRSDLREFTCDEIEWLLLRGSIKEINGFLKLNHERYMLIKNFYENDVISFAHRSDYEKDLLLQLEKAGEVKFGATFFSQQESDYLNFMLNKKKFSNGFDIRNISAHGNLDERFHDDYMFYLEILKTLILIVIKIDEEFCLRDMR